LRPEFRIPAIECVEPFGASAGPPLASQ
jgi:hypothetical protein